MQSEIAARVRNNPKFAELVESRNKFAFMLSGVMLVIYFGFILLLAFAPQVLAVRIGSSVITWGIPIGVAVIISAFVLTGIYVRRANTEFDRLTKEIVEEAK